MNMNGIIRMVMRLIMREGLSRGISAYQNRQERKAREDGASDEELQSMRQGQKRANDAIKFGRRIGRF